MPRKGPPLRGALRSQTQGVGPAPVAPQCEDHLADFLVSSLWDYPEDFLNDHVRDTRLIKTLRKVHTYDQILNFDLFLGESAADAPS